MDNFISFTPADFDNHALTRRTSYTRPDTQARQRDRVEEEGGPLQQPEGQVVPPTDVEATEFQTIKRVLDVLDEGRMDVVGFLGGLSWGNRLAITDPTTKQVRTNLMHSDRLKEVVSRWLSPPRTSQGGSRAGGAKRILMPLIVSTMEEVINKEMDAVVEELKEDSSAVTEQSVLGMAMEEIQETVQKKASVFYNLVKTAAWSKEQDERNTLKDPTKRVSFIICQAAFSRNHLANKMHRPISLYLKACGTAVKAFDTMSALGVTLSQKWALAAVESIAKHKMDNLVNQVKTTNFHTTHDNINRMFRVSHQRVGHNSHFDSGTAATVFIPPTEADYQLPETNEEFLRGAAEGATTPITAHEIQELHANAAPRIFAQNVHTVLELLVNAPAFEFKTYKHRDSEIFTRPPVSEALPTGPGHKLDQYLMRTAKIDEASHEGNRQWLDEWARQLGLDSDEEKEKTGQNRIIVWSGDQLTASRLRGLKTLRSMDSIPHEQLCWMEPIFGWFHLQMAFATSLHKQYLGTKAGIGFSRAFELLGKKGLASTKVKGNWFHDFEETLKETAAAHLLCTWFKVTGTSSVNELRSKSPEELKHFAERIVLEFASTAALEESSRQPPSKRDELQEQVIQLNRDLLEYLELDDAIKQGHISRMEDLLPSLLYRFQGGDNKLYALEVTELLQKLHKEWIGDVKRWIKRYCWLGNTTGRPGGFCPIDMIQEHNIRDIKGVFDTMGPTTSWEYVGKISPAIPTLRRLVDRMEGTVNSYRRYKKHTVKSAEDDVAKLMLMFHESAVHHHVDGRKVEGKEKFTDIWTKGFNIVSKGESLARWFENRSELQPARDNSFMEDYGMTFSELEEEMEWTDEREYPIDLGGHDMWWRTSDDAPSSSASSEC